MRALARHLCSSAVIVALTLAASIFALAQQPSPGGPSAADKPYEPPMTGSVSTGSPVAYSRTKPDDRGRSKVTDYKEDITYAIDPVGKDFKPVDTIVCGNRCVKKVHAKHEACNLDCDKRCEATHKVHVLGRYDWDERADDRIQKAMKAAIPASASGDVFSGAFFLRSKLNEIAEKSELTMTVPHIAAVQDKPCTIEEDQYGVRRHAVHVKVRVYAVAHYETSKADEPIGTTEVKTIEEDVADLWLPDRTPVAGKPKVVCLCEPPPVEKTPPPVNKTATFSGLSGACCFTTPGGAFVSWGPPDGVSITCRGMDMNKMQCTIQNTTDQTYLCQFGAGTLCVPTDPAVQEEICTLQQVVLIPPPGSVQRWGPDTPGGGSVDPSVTTFVVRLRCLEVNKKEPTDETGFRLVACEDEGLRELARISSTVPTRGAQDQARYWILRDQSTWQHLRERLMPPISGEQYMGALYDVATWGHVNTGDARFAACFDPKLVLEPCARSDCQRWFATRAFRQSPDAAASEVRQNAAKRLLALGDTPGSVDLQPFVIAAQVLGTSEKRDHRMVAIDMLRSTVPQALRRRLADLGALTEVPAWLRSDSADEALAAIDIVDLYAYTPATDALRVLFASGTTDAMRTKASAVLGHLALPATP